MWPFGSAIEPTSPGRVVRRDLNGLLAEFGQAAGVPRHAAGYWVSACMRGGPCNM
jgi:hypothetical protein